MISVEGVRVRWAHEASGVELAQNLLTGSIRLSVEGSGVDLTPATAAELAAKLEAAAVYGHSFDTVIIHACPPQGSGVMPCCGRAPAEVPATDRVTLYPENVTCSVSSRRGST